MAVLAVRKSGSLYNMALIALVLIEAIALIQLMISPIGGFLGTIIGPLTGAFVGVFLGFKLNDYRRTELDKKRRSFFKDALLHEIDRSIELLEMENINLIPVYVWDSLVNSGDLALFANNIVSD